MAGSSIRKTCIFLAVLSSLSLVLGRPGGSGQRHRFLFSTPIPDDMFIHGTTISKDLLQNMMEADMKSLVNRPTLFEDANRTSAGVDFPNQKDLPKLLKAAHPVLADVAADRETRKQITINVFDAITRVLNFYNNELDQVVNGDTALSLIILKEIDDKHGSIFQERFKIEGWIQNMCDSLQIKEKQGRWCSIVARKWKNKSGQQTDPKYWKPASYLQSYIDQTDNDVVENIGTEREGLWGTLNGECQTAIVERCEVPYVCERTLLDPVPRSQYLLTHQLMQRLLIEVMECPETKKFETDEETYANLCTKMYLEAQYLDILGMPQVHRDLFAEYVGFCGYMGYTNFLRKDWLEQIFSWQTKSDSGCFSHESLFPYGIITTDFGFQRKSTKKELELGIDNPDEECFAHLTSVSLTALSAYWDYLMDSFQTEFINDEL